MKTPERGLALMLGSAVLLSGCGAIFGGTRQSIQVQSSPAGATVSTDPGTGTYTTPTQLTLERKHSYILTFTSPGYSTATFNINNRLRVGIVVLDVLFTGLVGVVVDGATGAWYALSPETATVALTRTMALGDGLDTIHVTVSRDGAVDGPVSLSSDVPGVAVHVRIR